MGNELSNSKNPTNINFEDVQLILQKQTNTYDDEEVYTKHPILIHTFVDVDVKEHDDGEFEQQQQRPIIKGTLNPKTETMVINQMMDGSISKRPIVVYGKNYSDQTIYIKAKQLVSYGFTVYIYAGGIFEWLCLQEIFDTTLFPTSNATSEESDLLKYSVKSHFRNQSF